MRDVQRAPLLGAALSPRGTSRSSPRAAAIVALRRLFVVFTTVAAAACSDASGPGSGEPTLTIVPVVDSVFESDVVHLAARLSSGSGAEGGFVPATWTVSDSTLAAITGDGTLTLLRPGAVRITAHSGAAVADYDLTIHRLIVQRVELTPVGLKLGRGDRLSLGVRVFGQGDRAITGRAATLTSSDTLVAAVGGVGYPPEYLRAVGLGSTTIRATVDSVIGTLPVNVVNADTTFALTQYNGSPLPVLVAADTVTIDGVKEFDEVYAEAGTFVLSGVLQKRYLIDVRYTQYHVIQSGDSVIREPRVMPREFDRGLVTVGASGNLAMESEFIYPLSHTAAPTDDGFLVHFRIAGDDTFLDLRYRRVAP